MANETHIGLRLFHCEKVTLQDGEAVWHERCISAFVLPDELGVQQRIGDLAKSIQKGK